MKQQFTPASFNNFGKEEEYYGKKFMVQLGIIGVSFLLAAWRAVAGVLARLINPLRKLYRSVSKEPMQVFQSDFFTPTCIKDSVFTFAS